MRIRGEGDFFLIIGIGDFFLFEELGLCDFINWFYYRVIDR